MHIRKNINQNDEAYSYIVHILSSDVNLIKVDITDLHNNIDENNNTQGRNISSKLLYGDIQTMQDITMHNKFVNIQLNDNNEFVSIYDTEYINNNYHSMSCLVNIILEYKPYFEGKWNSGKKLYKTQPEFTYQGIYKYLFPQDEYVKGRPIGVSLNHCEKFFYAFGIHCTVYDIHLKELYKFNNSPSYPNKRVTPNNLKLIYSNGHVQKCDVDNDKSLSQIINKIQEKYTRNLLSLEKINYSYAKTDYKDFVIIHKANDIIEQYKKVKSENLDFKDKDISFIHFDFLNKIVIELIKVNKLKPKVKNDGTNIVTLFFTISDKQEIINKKTNKVKKIYVKYNIFVKSYQLDTDGHSIDDFTEITNVNKNKNEAIEKILKLQEITNKVRDQMLDKKIMSLYNDETFNFIHYYRPHPICVKSEYIEKGRNISQIDISKAYTSEYLKITHVPVFTTFNYPKKYNNQKIVDFNIYLIKIYDVCAIYQEKYTITYGYNLKKMKKFTIIQFLEYSYIKKIDSKKVIQDCYGDYTLDHLITEKDRKFIMNSSIGMMGKFKDKKEKSTIAFTENEAQLLIKEHGGYYYKIIDDENKLFIHVTKSYKRYKNGFLPIHMMIYDNMRITLSNITNEMKKLNMTCYGYKTDAIYFRDNEYNIDTLLNKYGLSTKEMLTCEDDYNAQIYNPNYNIINNIGKLTYKRTIEEFDTVHGFRYADELIQNKKENYTREFKRNKIEVQNEYNVTEIVNKTIMYSLNAGSGKSQTCKNYIKNNNLNGLFVINNNNLGLEISKDGFTYITPHLLLNLEIEGQDKSANKYVKKIDLEEYDVIVFEEIFFNDLNILLKLYELMQNNKDKIFLANGDSDQLECKEDVIDSDKKAEFINIMFPNYIELEIIKRCGCLSK